MSYEDILSTSASFNEPPNGTDCGQKPVRDGYCAEIYKNGCWPEVPFGSIANITCPRIFGLNNTAYRNCTENGTWSEKIDFHECVNFEQLDFYMFINKSHVIGYSISTVALVISLLIFLLFRSLRCTRIRIHIQLFISFILNNITWIMWYEIVIINVPAQANNEWWCIQIYIMCQYFMVANYMWMFCESLHLHLALVVVFVREEVTMLYFYGIGWGLPLIIVGVQSLVRHFYVHDTLMCWMYPRAFSNWFITIPVCISLILSLIFLINVLRVLLTIMRPNSANPAPIGIRRAARAAFILTPLFGVQFFLLPTRPSTDHFLYIWYLFLQFIIIPFQGLCVACLFCFANHDVQQALGRFFHHYMHRNRRGSRWNSQYQYAGNVDSGGVYVVNGHSQASNMLLLPFNRKSTTTTRL